MSISSQADLPGSELVEQGLADLAAGRETEAALLLEIAAPRLRRVGVGVDPVGTAARNRPSTDYTRCSARRPTSIAATTRCSPGSSATRAPLSSMRPPVDRERLRALADRLGQAASTKTIVYLTGGATAVLEGWRASTVDVDIRIDPDSDTLLRALPALKEELLINIELASRPDFIPELPGWPERSPVVFEVGNVQVRHFDPYSQVLSEIERGFNQDLEDVANMFGRGLIRPERLLELYELIEPDLYRYPAIDPGAFRMKVARATEGLAS